MATATVIGGTTISGPAITVVEATASSAAATDTQVPTARRGGRLMSRNITAAAAHQTTGTSHASNRSRMGLRRKTIGYTRVHASATAGSVHRGIAPLMRSAAQPAALRLHLGGQLVGRLGQEPEKHLRGPRIVRREHDGLAGVAERLGHLFCGEGRRRLAIHHGESAGMCSCAALRRASRSRSPRRNASTASWRARAVGKRRARSGDVAR